MRPGSRSSLAFIVLQGLPAPPACGTRPARRARLPHRRGRRHARDERDLRSRAPCSAPAASKRAAGRSVSAPRPNSAGERRLVGRFADAVERRRRRDRRPAHRRRSAHDAALLLEYQGRLAIAAFLAHRAELRGAPPWVVATRANTQPAFGCYLPDPQAAIARPYGPSSSRSRATRSPRSPGSPTPASSATSGFHGPCRASEGSRADHRSAGAAVLDHGRRQRRARHSARPSSRGGTHSSMRRGERART